VERLVALGLTEDEMRRVLDSELARAGAETRIEAGGKR